MHCVYGPLRPQVSLARKILKAEMLRWVLLLQSFDFDVVDTKGAENLRLFSITIRDPHKNKLIKELNEKFPLETLSSIASLMLVPHVKNLGVVEFIRSDSSIDYSMDCFHSMIPSVYKIKEVKQCMRTRSQARNQNRRQQQLTTVIVEEPEFPMADNRTMAQMLQAPIEGYEDAIVVWKRIFKKRSKKKAKNKQIQAREGKDQVKSKSKVIRMKKIQLEGLKLPSLKLYYKRLKRQGPKLPTGQRLQLSYKTSGDQTAYSPKKSSFPPNKPSCLSSRLYLLFVINICRANNWYTKIKNEEIEIRPVDVEWNKAIGNRMKKQRSGYKHDDVVLLDVIIVAIGL
ncbi:hypothetical protein Tco_0261087 [Tanacetum coccineum]